VDLDLETDDQWAEALFEEEMEAASREPVILGIDPAIASIGYGIIQGSRAIDYGVITTDSNTPTLDRLDQIYVDVKELCGTYKPTMIALEQPFFGRENTNAAKVLEALGCILLAIKHSNLRLSEPLILLHQSQVKAQVARGNSSKKEIQAAVMNLFDLPSLPKPDDAADGLAIAYAAQCGTRSNIKQ
jgi:crossover junction endodeoxyribonuclease RuvC